jgi:hypothetical protein
MLLGWNDIVAAWSEDGLLLALALLFGGLGLFFRGDHLGRFSLMLVLPLATSLAVGWWTSSWWAVAGVWVLWVGVPVSQFVRGMGRMRVARLRDMVPVWATEGRYSELLAVSSRWDEAGFRSVADYALEPSETPQVMRFMLSQEARHLVMCGWVGQGEMVMTHSAVVSRDADGLLWVTWNYPLPYGLKMAPEHNVWLCPDTEDGKPLLEAHGEFMKLNGVEPMENALWSCPDHVRSEWKKFMDRQMEFNLYEGWLRLFADGREVGYSWRGLVGVMGQIFGLMLGMSR